MKIQGLNQDDFYQIDRAFRHLMSDQAKQIKGAAECSSPEMIRHTMEGTERTLKTYEKIEKEMRRYEEKK